MGQKVNPHGARVGVIIDWSTKWYAGKKDFSNNLIEDYNLRKMLKEKLNQAGISHIDLQRAGEKLHVIVYTAKPGIVIGRGGAMLREIGFPPELIVNLTFERFEAYIREREARMRAQG